VLRRTLNLGILAHVDAGKTTLTERLLYAAGVIDEFGSVDDGSTQTDSLALERQRGITIKSAVVSFAIADVTVNLIDTPGHPDFIAEVERVLGVLDGAVLVISAVEGVQPQTRVLMRALQRLRVPTLMFVNKIDRRGADCERVLESASERLSPAIVPLGSVQDAGTRAARFIPWTAGDADFAASLASTLAEHDDQLLAAYVENEGSVSYGRLRAELAAQSRQALVQPVLFGSALTGAGVDSLMSGLVELLPAAAGDVDGPVSGAVFKIERGPAGEKIAYVRMFSGSVRVRDRLQLGHGDEEKVTAISVFDRGSAVRARAVVARQIGKLWGLGTVKVGDAIGLPGTISARSQFAPPTLETVVVPRRAGEKGALHLALAQLAEQDPLIDLRQDGVRHDLFLSLYGEVQKEVIQQTLASDFGIDVTFRETTTICIERPNGVGAAVETIQDSTNPFLGTVGLRVEPGEVASGVAFRLGVELGSMPLAFHRAVEETVRETLAQGGIYGWQVTDCIVTLTHSGFFNTSSTAGDFRNLTPLVLMSALKQAGTTVYEPIHRFHLELPADRLGPLLPVLARLRAVPRAPTIRGLSCTLEGDIPAARVHELRLELPAVTRGEGVLDCALHRYQPAVGRAPTRPRSERNPLNREEYLLRVARRASLPESGLVG
jgi:ribosomal protection tetracycline resistance protein